jgi:S1-C subfamily serine protease/tetratricopeptide (TPR) repeat protein
MVARAMIGMCRGAAVMSSLWLCTAPLFGQAKDPRDGYGTRSLEAAKLIKSANDLHGAGKLKDARTAIDAAMKIDPADDFIYYVRGNILCDLGDVDLGIEDYKKAFELGRSHFTNITIDTAVNLGIVNGQLKRYNESSRWFSMAIVTDPLNTTKLTAKAYRNLAITLMQEEHFADAAIAAISGRQLAPETVEIGLVRECFKRALEADDTEVFHGLFLQALPPAVVPRAAGPDLAKVTVTGDPLDQPIDQLLPDPQGRWIIAIAFGQPAFSLLKPDAKTVKATRITAPAAIQSACLVAGHFYVATKDPARLMELDPASGRSLQSWNLPAIAASIAVFPSTGTAYFPNRGSIWALNLKTGNAVSTGKDGQTVIGHPGERYLLTRAKDENSDGGTSVFNVDGHSVIVTSPSTDMMPTTLIEYYCSGERLIVSAVRDAASSNGYDVSLSPDGNYAALPGGGGWRSASAKSQKLAGYVIPVYATADLHLQAAFVTDAYPKGLAINPVTGQVAAVREADARLYHLAASQDAAQTLKGPFRGASAWSGDGRFLILAADKGIAAYINATTPQEQALAATWWRKIGPEKSAATVVVQAAPALPALRAFRPAMALPEVRKTLADAARGTSVRPAAWSDLPAYTGDKAFAAELAGIAKEAVNGTSNGPRLFRLKQLARAHPESAPLKYFLADASVAADQGEQARTLLLDVVHVDAGQTELSLLSLRLLAKLLIADKQLVAAAHCVAVAYGLDRADPATRNLAAELFPAVGLKDALDAMQVEQGPAAAAAEKPLPALASLAPDAPTLLPTALYQKAAKAVLLIQCGNSSGTGFCVGDANTLVTSLHVLSDDERIQVFPFFVKDGKLQRGKPVAAEIVARSDQQDLAILRVGAITPALVPLPVIAVDPPPGARVYAVGNPGLADQSLDLTMSDGIVSAANRTLEKQTLLQHTASVNPGNSGGPLLNKRGEVVGVVCLDAKLKGVSFATPASVVRQLFQASKNPAR